MRKVSQFAAENAASRAANAASDRSEFNPRAARRVTCTGCRESCAGRGRCGTGGRCRKWIAWPPQVRGAGNVSCRGKRAILIRHPFRRDGHRRCVTGVSVEAEGGRHRDPAERRPGSQISWQGRRHLDSAPFRRWPRLNVGQTARSAEQELDCSAGAHLAHRSHGRAATTRCRPGSNSKAPTYRAGPRG